MTGVVKRYNSDKMKQLVFKIYQGYGFSAEQSEQLAEMLIYTDLHGIESGPLSIK